MMKPAVAKLPSAIAAQTARSAGARLPILVVMGFLLGAGLAGTWFKYCNRTNGSLKPGPQLSDSTLALLRQLPSPVEIRFYSVLPPGGAPDSLRDFSGRVDHLLSEFQGANTNQISVTRNPAPAGSVADAAGADGLQPFNLDKDACFLGIAVASGGRNETLGRLQPEWEAALPYDLIRAIQRVSVAAPAAPLAREVAKPSAEIVDSIHRLIPDISAASVEQADQIFHAEFMKEYEQASGESEAQVKAAQQRVVQAQNSGSADELAAAQKDLLQVQLAQGDRIKRIAADLQTRLAVFQQMKADGAPAK